MDNNTSKQAVEEYCKKGGFALFDSSKNERLWAHDLMHTLIEGPFTHKGEEIVGIYQAVLFRDPLVTTRSMPWQDGGHEITLDDIHKRIIAGVRKFNRRLALKWNPKFVVKPELTEGQIEEHFARAKVLANLIHQEFDHHLGELSIGDVQSMPYERLAKVKETMQELCEPHRRKWLARLTPGETNTERLH